MFRNIYELAKSKKEAEPNINRLIISCTLRKEKNLGSVVKTQLTSI